MTWINRQKHTILLALLVLEMMFEPVVVGWSKLLAYLVIVAIFPVVFEKKWQRRVAISLGVPAIVLDCSQYVAPSLKGSEALLAFHVLIMLLMVFSVAVILVQIFQRRTITPDHVVGAFCGYILVAMAWGHLYMVIDRLAPEAFSIRPEVAWQMENEQLRRYLFNHLSLSTMSPLAAVDVTPALPLVNTLTWLEALFGQFYLAVFIGQLVAMRMNSSRANATS